MPQKPRPRSVSVPNAKVRPVQDVITVKQQAGQFPSVGMTLRSYQYDSRDYHKRSAGRAVVVTQNRRSEERRRSGRCWPPGHSTTRWQRALAHAQSW